MSRLTKKQIDALAATGKIRSHNAPDGANLADHPTSKGVLPKGGSTSKAKQDFMMRVMLYCHARKLPVFFEQPFDKVRKWRFDILIPGIGLRGAPVALEYEGIMSEGVNGHTGIRSYVDNCDKYNAAAIAGITVLRYTARNYNEALSDLEMFFL